MPDEEANQQRFNLFVQRCLLGKDAKTKERNVVEVSEGDCATARVRVTNLPPKITAVDDTLIAFLRLRVRLASSSRWSVGRFAVW